MALTALRCRISELTDLNGWSLGYLSERTGIAKSTLSAYDTMRSKDMPLRNAIIISEVFGCRPEELYVWDRP